MRISVKAGSEATTPLSAILARSQPGASLPLVGSLLQVESDQVLLTAAKRADDGSGWVLRLCNPDPEDAGAYLRFGKGKFAGAYACSAAEESAGKAGSWRRWFRRDRTGARCGDAQVGRYLKTQRKSLPDEHGSQV